jgi:type II secretory pathway component PulK
VEGLNGEWSNNPAVLANARKSGCFPDLNTFLNVASHSAGQKLITVPLDTRSMYFQLTTRVTLGTTEFTLYSLLVRGQTKVTPLLRSFGTL